MYLFIEFFNQGAAVPQASDSWRLHTHKQHDIAIWISRCDQLAHGTIWPQQVSEYKVTVLLNARIRKQQLKHKNFVISDWDFYNRMELNLCRNQLESRMRSSSVSFKQPPTPEEFEGIPF